MLPKHEKYAPFLLIHAEYGEVLGLLGTSNAGIQKHTANSQSINNRDIMIVRFQQNGFGLAVTVVWKIAASFAAFWCAAAPLKGEDWEGAEVTKILVDGNKPSSSSISMALSLTGHGCRVAILVGDLTNGFAVRVDGVEGALYEDIREETPIFSADGSAVAYCARKNRKWQWVINGVEGPAFDKLTATSFVFSADGKRHAYVAIPGFRRNVMVIDGRVIPRGAQGDTIPADAAPLFSPDGSRLAYVEQTVEKQKDRVNLNGKAGPWTQEISKRHSRGFGAYKNGMSASGLVPRPRPPVYSMSFSADSKHFAYNEFVNRSARWVIDGKSGALHDGLGIDFAFAPSGADHAYMARSSSQRAIFQSRGNPIQIDAIVADTLTFSPDGNHLAFAGIRNGKRAIWLDGEAAPLDLKIRDFTNAILQFSPDSKRLAYVVEGPESLHYVVDGNIGPDAFAFTDGFSFSPDSTHFCYVLKPKGTRRFGIVMDGKIRATHPQVLGGIFRSDGDFEYLAINEKNQLFRYLVAGY